MDYLFCYAVFRFAFAESVLYLLASENIFSTAIVRSLTAVPPFCVCSFYGAFYGLARFTLLDAAHYLFLRDLFQLFLSMDFMIFLISILMPLGFNSISFLALLVGIIISLFLIKKSQKYSPYVRGKNG